MRITNVQLKFMFCRFVTAMNTVFGEPLELGKDEWFLDHDSVYGYLVIKFTQDYGTTNPVETHVFGSERKTKRGMYECLAFACNALEHKEKEY